MALTSDAPRPDRPVTLYSIQYLRAFAAFSVVLFHQLQAHSLFKLGAHGVDLFFVISGFIMVAISDGRQITPQQFMLDRIVRIAPPYWIATAMAFVLMSMHFPFHDGSNNFAHFIKSLFFVPDLDGNGHVWPTVYLGWTLNYEMFFYIIFALTLFVKPDLRVRLLTVCLLIAVMSGLFFKPTNPIAATYTNPRLAEFLAGAWIGTLFGKQLNKLPMRTCALGSIIVASALALASIWHPTLLYGSISVLLIAAGLGLERHGRMPKAVLLKLAGDASFAIYLFQQFAFEGVGTVCRRIDKLAGSHLAGHAPDRTASILLALALGFGVFMSVEKPLTRFLRRLLKNAIPYAG